MAAIPSRNVLSLLEPVILCLNRLSGQYVSAVYTKVANWFLFKNSIANIGITLHFDTNISHTIVQTLLYHLHLLVTTWIQFDEEELLMVCIGLEITVLKYISIHQIFWFISKIQCHVNYELLWWLKLSATIDVVDGYLRSMGDKTIPASSGIILSPMSCRYRSTTIKVLYILCLVYR